MKKVFSLMAALLVFCLVGCGGGGYSVTIEPIGNEMKYDTTSFQVKPGQEVTLIMNNTATAPAMKHNIVVLNSADIVEEVGLAAAKEADFLPDNPGIIAATAMAEPGTQVEVSFTAPTEPGEYPFICTYPGHYMMMRGVMVVAN